MTNPRSQVTILDVAKLGAMFLLGFGALKSVENHSGLVQLAAFVVGFVSVPLSLWILFTLIDRRKRSSGTR